VRVISGEARVDERDPGGEWLTSHTSVGDFFLTRTLSPYEMRWEAYGDVPFQVMHLNLTLPLFERIATEMLGKAGRTLRLRDVSGARDETLSHVLDLVHLELLRGDDQSPLLIQGLAQSLAMHLVRTYADDSQDHTVSNGNLTVDWDTVNLRNRMVKWRH
jgi:AraC family transcriptional regulator